MAHPSTKPRRRRIAGAFLVVSAVAGGRALGRGRTLRRHLHAAAAPHQQEPVRLVRQGDRRALGRHAHHEAVPRRAARRRARCSSGSGWSRAWPTSPSASRPTPRPLFPRSMLIIPPGKSTTADESTQADVAGLRPLSRAGIQGRQGDGRVHRRRQPDRRDPRRLDHGRAARSEARPLCRDDQADRPGDGRGAGPASGHADVYRPLHRHDRRDLRLVQQHHPAVEFLGRGQVRGRQHSRSSSRPPSLR